LLESSQQKYGEAQTNIKKAEARIADYNAGE